MRRFLLAGVIALITLASCSESTPKVQYRVHTIAMNRATKEWIQWPEVDIKELSSDHYLKGDTVEGYYGTYSAQYYVIDSVIKGGGQ